MTNSSVMWLRHHRRLLTYIAVILGLVLALAPQAQETRSFDTYLGLIGVALALCGQTLRLWAWGTNPKSALRLYGPYQWIRHPLYAGNFLIASGLLLNVHSPVARFVVIPALALLYWIIAANEEEKLQKRFGTPQREYQAKVPRFVPWRGQVIATRESVSFNWKQALDKERDSICGWVAGMMALHVYQNLIARGLEGLTGLTLFFLVMSLLVGVVSLSCYLLRRPRKNKPGLSKEFTIE